MSEKTYVGKGKVVGNYGMISFWIDTNKLAPNEKGYARLTIGKMRNTDDKGNTHTVWIDDYVPNQRDNNYRPPAPSPRTEPYNEQGGAVQEDLPF